MIAHVAEADMEAIFADFVGFFHQIVRELGVAGATRNLPLDLVEPEIFQVLCQVVVAKAQPIKKQPIRHVCHQKNLKTGPQCWFERNLAAKCCFFLDFCPPHQRDVEQHGGPTDDGVEKQFFIKKIKDQKVNDDRGCGDQAVFQAV